MRVRNKNRVNRLHNQLVLMPSSPLMLLVLISLNFGKDNTPEKFLERMRKHILMLTGNANFAVTDPTLAEVQDMADDLEEGIDLVNAGDNSKITHRDTLFADAKEMIRQLSYNIQYLSAGDKEKIESAGFNARKIPGAPQSPGQVLNLVTKPVGPGKVKLRWKRDANTKVYAVEMQTLANPPFPNVSWESMGKTSKVSFLVEGLIPGQLYFFRVYGSNGNEDGNPSDPAEQRSL